MRRLLPFIIPLAIIGCGCRIASYPIQGTDGKTRRAWVGSFLTNAKIDELRVEHGTNIFHLKGASSQIDNDSLKAIVEGATSAAIKVFAPIP